MNWLLLEKKTTHFTLPDVCPFNSPCQCCFKAPCLLLCCFNFPAARVVSIQIPHLCWNSLCFRVDHRRRGRPAAPPVGPPSLLVMFLRPEDPMPSWRQMANVSANGRHRNQWRNIGWTGWSLKSQKLRGRLRDEALYFGRCQKPWAVWLAAAAGITTCSKQQQELPKQSRCHYPSQ
jgi:hypothetical protein